jgi:hypothetical protein
MRFKMGDVQGHRRLRLPSNFLSIDVQEPIGLGERVPEIVQQVAQVGPGLPLGGVGPEKEGEMVTRVRGVSVEQEIDEQCLRPGASDALHRLPSGRETETAEQANVEQRLEFCGVHRPPLRQSVYL